MHFFLQVLIDHTKFGFKQQQKKLRSFFLSTFLETLLPVLGQAFFENQFILTPLIV